MQTSLTADGCSLLAANDLDSAATEQPKLSNLLKHTQNQLLLLKTYRLLSGCRDRPPCLLSIHIACPHTDAVQDIS